MHRNTNRPKIPWSAAINIDFSRYPNSHFSVTTGLISYFDVPIENFRTVAKHFIEKYRFDSWCWLHGRPRTLKNSILLYLDFHSHFPEKIALIFFKTFHRVFTRRVSMGLKVIDFVSCVGIAKVWKCQKAIDKPLYSNSNLPTTTDAISCYYSYLLVLDYAIKKWFCFLRRNADEELGG